MKGIGQLIGFVLWVLPVVLWNQLFGAKKTKPKDH